MKTQEQLIKEAFKPGPDTADDFRKRMDEWLDADELTLRPGYLHVLDLYSDQIIQQQIDYRNSNALHR